MSLYTPIFPATEPPARQATQSSYSSFDTARTSRISYSSRLSQWHLGIAALPEVLCPPSPPQPGYSKLRSVKLQSEIEEAVRCRRAVPDHCQLLCVRLSASTEPRASGSVDPANLPIGPLVDTEEEWFEWESRSAADTRARPNDMDHALAGLSEGKQGGAHEKVLNWKATLQQPSIPPITASQPLAGPSHTQSTLGFPVVKRPSLVKESKSKQLASDRATTVPLHSRHPSRRGSGTQRAVSPVPAVASSSSRGMVADVETSYPSNSKPEQDQLQVAAGNGEYNNAASSATRPLADIPESLPDFSNVPPPSFPVDIPTSTPKDAHQNVHGSDGFMPSLHPFTNLQEQRISATQVTTVLEECVPDPQPSAMKESGVSESTTLNVEPAKLRISQPTPPSPPYTSPATPTTPSHESQAAQPMDVTASPKVNVEPRTNQLLRRPITPPSEHSARNQSGVSPAIEESKAPQTPTRSPHRSGLRSVEATPRLSPTSKGLPMHQRPSSLMNVAGPSTPDAAINGMSPVKFGPDFIIMPSSKHGPTPKTPERTGTALPTTTELLATSRKSVTRPRPPSRKTSVSHMDVDVDDPQNAGLVDPSPAKSDRSYFSSPASSSSSGSDASDAAHSYLPSAIHDSPTVGFGFTQDPDRFLPIGESTVILDRRPAAAAATRKQSRPRSVSPTARKRATSQLDEPSQSQKSIRGFYNSQFDVNDRVDKLSSFLARDVDLNYWDRDPGQVLVEGSDDEEDVEDAVAVEQLTFALSPS